MTHNHCPRGTVPPCLPAASGTEGDPATPGYENGSSHYNDAIGLRRLPVMPRSRSSPRGPGPVASPGPKGRFKKTSLALALGRVFGTTPPASIPEPPAPPPEGAPAQAADARAELVLREPALASLTSGARSSVQNPALVYLASLAPGSRRTMRHALQCCAELLYPGSTFESFPWSMVRREHVQWVRAQLSDRLAPTTANKMLSALRGTVREAVELEQIPANEGARAVSVKSVRGKREAKGRALDRHELGALFAACEHPHPEAAARNTAVLALAYGGGLRRAELVGLDIEDLDLARGMLRVRGKGDRERRVPLPTGSLAALRDWVALRGDRPGPLLLPLKPDGAMVTSRRLSDQAIYALLRRMAPRAGVGPLSPHDLRRSFISDLLDAGADLSVVQQLAGHASPTTTARYDRRPEAARQSAVERLEVPSRGQRAAAHAQRTADR